MSGEECTRVAAMVAYHREHARLSTLAQMGAGDPIPAGAPMVLRHGGRTIDRWRFRGWGADAFDKLAKEMRQGGVALVTASEVTRFTSAPRLRRRW